MDCLEHTNLPIGFVVSSIVLTTSISPSHKMSPEHALGALLAQCSLLDGRGVSHQLRQSAAELVEATLSDYLRPLALGGEAHIAYHLREIPSALGEAYDPGASVRGIGGALQIAPLLKIAQ